jgi:hypothetical protein
MRATNAIAAEILASIIAVKSTKTAAAMARFALV